ncbi:DUF4810 domain-containing protein [Derxia lacustris]|uniref:DUF4810 domain-containing protein n=1 Tax=Derxia lacustris TaxID=764842 RepID=UPI000A172A53|nr:DUF4810 domain-containing protein [Derxia lacustris]
MRRLQTSARLLAAAAVLLTAGCAAPPPKPLYMWEGFPRGQYETLLHDGSSSPQDQIQKLEAVAEKARGANAALPPGFRAHLGLLHLTAGDSAQARALWQAERATFPESAPYIDQLLKRLDPPASADARKAS